MPENRTVDLTDEKILSGVVERTHREFISGKRFDNKDATDSIEFRGSDHEIFKNKVIDIVTGKVFEEILFIRSNIVSSGVIPDNIEEDDVKYVWHPYTQMAESGEDELMIRSAKGAVVTDIDGKEYIDGVGGKEISIDTLLKLNKLNCFVGMNR